MAITQGKPLYKSEGKLIGDGYTIIIMEDDKKRDKPFSDSPHRIEISKSTKAITLINRYPSMARVIDSDIKSSIQKQLPKHLKLAEGINLLTISKDFYPSLDFSLIPSEVLEAIFISMKEAIIYCILESIEKDYYDIPVNPFFNIGTKVGGSQPRIHSQVYIDLNGDGHGSRLEGYLKAFKEMGENLIHKVFYQSIKKELLPKIQRDPGFLAGERARETGLAEAYGELMPSAFFSEPTAV